MDDASARMARGLWTLYEPVHAVTYFAPQAAAAFAGAGLQGFWRGYFAGRSAPLGAVGSAPVVALFSSFSPPMVERALPSVWGLVTPVGALDARAAGAAAAIRTSADADDVLAAARGLEEVAGDLPFPGRPLAAANAAVPSRSDPYERLWQAATTLREWRGDAHIAALLTHGLAGLDILVLRCRLDIDRAGMQRARGWTDTEWAVAADRLTRRGLIAGDRVTRMGRELITTIERATDSASVIGSAQQMRALGRVLHPVAVRCASLMPFPNPIGLVSPWDPIDDPQAAGIPRP